MRQEDDHWTDPQTASFSGDHNDDFPFMSSDGNRIYFCSNRPFPARTEQNTMTYGLLKDPTQVGLPRVFSSNS